MEGGEDEVACLCSCHGCGYRLRISHLAYHTDIYVLAEHGCKGRLEARRIRAHFALVYYGFFGFEYVFDRIFDGEDMLGARLIYEVDHAGKRRGFALTDRTDHQKESLRLS